MKKYIQSITLAGLSLVSFTGAHAISTEQELWEFFHTPHQDGAERAAVWQSEPGAVAKDFAVANPDIDKTLRARTIVRWSRLNRSTHADEGIELMGGLVSQILADPEYYNLSIQTETVSLYRSLGGVVSDQDFNQVMTRALGKGLRGWNYVAWFRRHAQTLAPAPALSLIEAEIRGLLSQPASSTRDAWIKELRAQHVILQSFVQ